MPIDYKSYFQSKETERWLIAVLNDPYDNSYIKNDTTRKETV